MVFLIKKIGPWLNADFKTLHNELLYNFVKPYSKKLKNQFFKFFKFIKCFCMFVNELV